MRGLFVRSLLLLSCLAVDARADAWRSWRGASQVGHSPVHDLPSNVAVPGPNLRWSLELKSRGTPVIDAQGRLYVMGYKGEGADVRERLVAVDAFTGKPAWEHVFNDFLSDVVYDRYAIGAPAIDPATGHVYAVSAAGLFTAFTRDGQILWQFSAMETLGRMTFTNSRNGAPVIVGDLIITHWMTANWGAQAPPRDRFYAFDKRTGAPVWASTPAPDVAPKDNSFSTPVVLEEGTRTLFYAGTGDGHIVCMNALTGDLVWKHRISQGGVNGSVLVDEARVIVAHGTENIDKSSTGRMVAVSRDGGKELWRLDLSAFSSSAVLAGGRVYQVDDTGALWAIEAATGRVAWTLKLARDQVHASPLFADGRLYVPTNDGMLHVVEPGENAGRVVSSGRLEGNSLGAPATWSHTLYVTTNQRVYAFREPSKARVTAPAVIDEPEPVSSGKATALGVMPNELWLKPGEKVRLTPRELDAEGHVLGEAKSVTYEPWVPPTAKVRSFLDASVDANGMLIAGAKPSAGALMAKSGELSGTLRGRLLAVPPFQEDFDTFELAESDDKGGKYAFPPLPWIGARMAWEVRELDGRKVLAKTLTNPILQRSRLFMGHPEVRDYMVSADVMSDGNRRVLGDVGVINQRYVVAIRGNWQVLEVSSNDERLKVSVPFKWRPGVWHRLVTRVDHRPDGTAQIRAKAWPLGQPEPKKWLLDVKHKKGHANGAPGLYGFAPDSLFKVYVDNVDVREISR